MTMSPTAASAASAAPLVPPVPPLLPSSTGVVTAAAVLLTRPGPYLSFPEQRILARFVEGMNRRLRHHATTDDHDAVAERLWDLVDLAGRSPVGDGVAVVATPRRSALLHLRGPVRDRTHVGGPVSRVDLGLHQWPTPPLAILVATSTGTRAVVVEDGIAREVAAGGLPLHRPRSVTPDEHVEVVGSLVDAVVDPDLPLVVGGEPEPARQLGGLPALRDRVAAVLPGDTSQAPIGELLDLLSRDDWSASTRRVR